MNPNNPNTLTAGVAETLTNPRSSRSRSNARRLLPAALLGLALALTACGNDSGADAGSHGGSHGGSDSSSEAGSEASSSSDFNDADVAFATDMVQHHAGALAMVDMTTGRELSPAVATLAEDIRAAQAPEIETMSDWLQTWGEPVPETMNDHANAHGDHGGGETGEEMPGMMSGEEMSQLEALQGEEFERAWLESMIEHHQGAIEMADIEMSEGENADAVALAEKIAADQQEEIEKMEQLLDS